MKKIVAICCVAIMMMVSMTAICFADSGTFKIKATYPEDKQTDTSVDNLCVKIYLEEGVSFANSLENKKSSFKITDDSGKNEIPFGMKYDEKENFILIFAFNEEKKTTLASDVGVENDAEYKVTVSKELTDDNGKLLQVDSNNADENGNYSISFKTQNMTRTMTVNMAMMGIMFAGIMIFSIRAAKKSKEEEENKGKKQAFNPYEEAKRTGKPVEQIIAREEKKKQKREKKEEQIRLQKEKEEAEIQAILQEEIRATYHKVKGPKPISEVGGKYKSGRKAKAEEKAKAAEKKAKSAKKKTSKSKKGKKKK